MQRIQRRAAGTLPVERSKRDPSSWSTTEHGCTVLVTPSECTHLGVLIILTVNSHTVSILAKISSRPRSLDARVLTVNVLMSYQLSTRFSISTLRLACDCSITSIQIQHADQILCLPPTGTVVYVQYQE